ncbi:MAG: peptidoglycan-binding domain-containing protein [bacterium]|nr:peptidoglycan-binding domain-containing protein [bacterium]
MRKFLLSSSITALLLPGLALAAYNDVTITTDTVISVGGVSLIVNGTNAVVESIAVGASSFTVSLSPGSFIEIRSANAYTIATDAPANYIVTDTCSATESILKLSSTISTGSMTVTPSASTCSGSASGNSTTAVSTGSGSGSGISTGGGGGGGGGGSIVMPTPTVTIPATPATTDNSSLTSEQRSALIVQLTAQLNTLLAQLAALQGQSPNASAYINANANASFKRDLQTGSTGDDVRALQAYLNSHGFTVSPSGAGSPGNETSRFGGLTRAALAKLQASVGITPAAGYLGPKTRAYIAANP